MTAERRNQRMARWGVPIGAVVATGAVAAGYALAGGPGAPVLPSRTTVQLLAAVNAAPSVPPMTATITATAALGLPSLPNMGTARDSNQMSPLNWLSGTHTIKLWYTDPAHVRLAAPVPMGETDVRRDGRNVWTWDSQNSRATHVILPSSGTAPGSSSTSSSSAYSSTLSTTITQNPPTPQQAAQQLLKAVGPTSRVGLQQNVTVAGQPAYQLTLAPKTSSSLVGQIRIAIAAKRALPLRVQVFARGATSPAFQLGYTAIQFGTPSASNYAFTPPPGAKVKTVTVPAHRERPLMHGTVMPGGWTGVPPRQATIKVPAKSVQVKLRAKPVQVKPGTKPVQVKPGTKLTPLRLHAVPSAGPVTGMLGPIPGATTIGKDWTAVAVLPAPGLAGVTVPGSGVNPGGPMLRGSATYGPGSRNVRIQQSPVGDLPAVIGTLMRAATPVHGAWGSGKLLTTSLVNVLVTNGRVLIGAVTPQVLYADAAQLKNQSVPAGPPHPVPAPKASKAAPKAGQPQPIPGAKSVPGKPAPSASGK